ncbi:MAG: FecR domain-containing protein [Rhodospirillales bacterium]|nr:FecR domain-containing protein [Rhodospirillales bacterium]
MKRKLAYQVCYAIAAIWALPNAASAAGIATVVDVVNEGYRTPPGADETAAKATDELVQDEALRTEKESVIQVKFVDGSELSVEQSSEMVLSDYVFDGSAASGLINLNNGLFHFKSNGQDDQGVKLRTPVATIGVRGTEFLVHVDGDDVTIVDILSGGVSATPHGTGKEITCYEGQSILIAGENEDAQCGDIGSFSTAAAPPGGNEGPAGGTRGGNGDKEKEVEVAEAPPARPAPVVDDDDDDDDECEYPDGYPTHDGYPDGYPDYDECGCDYPQIQSAKSMIAPSNNAGDSDRQSNSPHGRMNNNR